MAVVAGNAAIGIEKIGPPGESELFAVFAIAQEVTKVAEALALGEGAAERVETNIGDIDQPELAGRRHDHIGQMNRAKQNARCVEPSEKSRHRQDEFLSRRRIGFAKFRAEGFSRNGPVAKAVTAQVLHPENLLDIAGDKIPLGQTAGVPGEDQGPRFASQPKQGTLMADDFEDSALLQAKDPGALAVAFQNFGPGHDPFEFFWREFFYRLEKPQQIQRDGQALEALPLGAKIRKLDRVSD